MGLIPKIATDALKFQKWAKNNLIEPEKEFEQTKFVEGVGYVWTYQVSFKTEKELEMYLIFNNLINRGLFNKE